MTTYKATGNQKGKGFRYDFRYQGERYTKAWFPSRKAARDAEALRRIEVAANRLGAFVTFTELVDHFLAMSERTKSPAWAYQLKVKLNKGFEQLADLAPGELKPAHFEMALRALADTGLSNRSVNEYRKIAHSVMQYAVKLEALHRNPVSVVAKMPEHEVERKVIDTAALKRLVVAGDPFMSSMILFLSQTGARSVEARRLRETDIFLTETPPVCLLRTRKVRGGGEKAHVQVLTAPAVVAIRTAMENRPQGSQLVFPGPDGGVIAEETLRKRLVKLCAKADVARIGFHAIRHWTGKQASQAGLNRKAIAAFLRNPKVTDIYMHHVPAEVLEVAARVEQALGNVAVDNSQVTHTVPHGGV